MRQFSAVLALATSAVLAAGCAGGTSSSPVSVAIAPSTATVQVGKPQQFTAMVTGTTNTSVTWAVVGSPATGTITQTGLYTAPAALPNPPQATIKATPQANPAKVASVIVTLTATSSVSVVVNPNAANVANFGTQQFNATVTGSSNTSVTWNVNGVAGGSQQFGFISSSGLYVAPGGVPTTSNGSGGSVTTTVTVNAVSQAAASASGSAMVTIVPGNQAAESGAIELGTSGGNANDSSIKGNSITCCSGTLGALLTNGTTQYILSNTHVLAPRSDIASIGDPIIQPGLVDTLTCTPGGARTVANLTAFYNLETGPSPRIDAAIAQAIPPNVDSSGNILYLGDKTDANGVPLPGAPNMGSGAPASVGLGVAKSGRATGLTCSTVLAVGVMVNGVQYQKGCGTGATFTVNFTNQVVIAGGSFSAEGDSGSLIVRKDTAVAVGLLYGGSDMDSVANPIADVLGYFASHGNNLKFVGNPAQPSGHAVIGCSLPNQPASASATVPANAVSAQALQNAAAVRDAHAAELLAHPEVQALAVGSSYDNPRDAAIVVLAVKGQPRTKIPAEVDGVRTRIVERELFPKRGILSADDAKAYETPASANDVYPISEGEFTRAKLAHAAHASELLSQPGVQGVGIGSSLDAPGEAALVVFLVRGAAHDPVPPVVDGVRTRIRESSPFKAGFGDGRRTHACPAPAFANKKLFRAPN